MQTMNATFAQMMSAFDLVPFESLMAECRRTVQTQTRTRGAGDATSAARREVDRWAAQFTQSNARR